MSVACCAFAVAVAVAVAKAVISIIISISTYRLYRFEVLNDV